MDPGRPGQGRLRRPAVLAPDADRRFPVDQPAGDVPGNQFLNTGIDLRLYGEAGLEVRQVLLHCEQAFVLHLGDRQNLDGFASRMIVRAAATRIRLPSRPCTMQRMPSRDWTRAEVEAAVADYLDMLAREIRGEPFKKKDHNDELRKRLDGRSKGAVEFKHQNISAVLIAEGFPYIEGYKPRRNVQGELRKAVRERLPEIEKLIRADVEKRQAPADLPNIPDILGIAVDPPSLGEPAVGERRSDYLTPGIAAGPIDYLLREARNRSLGDAGEALVMDYERLRLERAGKDHLARNVEQVSKTKGDHMGFDIHSYEATGRDRFIEVKTTRYGRHTPFYISDGELRFSEEHAESYHLYRLFGFRKQPLLFTLPGDVSEHVQLRPVNYRAQF